MNAERFKQLFLPYGEKLYCMAYRLTGSRENAEDMVQETYLKLWNRRETLERVENAEAYVTRMLKNVCLDYLRTRHDEAEQEMPEEWNAPVGESLSEQLERNDEVRQIKQLICHLPSPQRQVMWLRDVGGCTMEEIERVTGLTAVNIRVSLSRARKKIREQFNQ